MIDLYPSPSWHLRYPPTSQALFASREICLGENCYLSRPLQVQRLAEGLANAQACDLVATSLLLVKAT